LTAGEEIARGGYQGGFVAEIVLTEGVALGPVLWRVSWPLGSGGPFYVWGDGVLLGATDNTFWDVTVGIGRVVQVSVFDDAADVPPVWYPASVTLRWEGRNGDVVYRVDSWDGSAWVSESQVLADSRRVYHWDSGTVADGVTWKYRVVPLDGQGRSGTALEFTGVMCRYPDAPVVGVAFDGGEVVISAAE
jgi:hypothetical protein